MKKLFTGMMLLGVMNSAAVLAAGSDELWEITTKMDVKGMAMPMATQTSCLPKGGAYKPEKGSRDKNCEMTDIQVSGNTTKWKMHCSGKDAMEGSGEMTRTADTMNGTIKMSMKNGQMTQVMSGKRVGTCDAAAERKKIDDQMGAMMEDVCSAQVGGALASGGREPKMPELFAQKEKCAASKPSLCEKAQTFAGGYDGYNVYAKSKGWVAKECGISLEAKRAALCQTAVSDKKNAFFSENCPAEIKVLCKQSLSDRKFGTVAKYCPVEAKALSEKNCGAWGRDYTSDHDNDYAPICSKYSKNKVSYGDEGDNELAAEDEGGNELAGKKGADSTSSKGSSAGKSKESAAARKEEKSSMSDNPAGAVLDGAKKLKGLFNF